MSNLSKIMGGKKVGLPDDATVLLSGCKSFKVFDNVNKLAIAPANAGFFTMGFAMFQQDYLEIIPMNYQYSFLTTDNNE